MITSRYDLTHLGQPRCSQRSSTKTNLAQPRPWHPEVDPQSSVAAISFSGLRLPVALLAPRIPVHVVTAILPVPSPIVLQELNP